jgi:translation initiation factor 2 subunit 2
MEYKELLKEVLAKVPRTEISSRFVVPKAIIELAGQKTIITNFSEIASVLRRPQEHVIKFLLKELATKGQLSGNRLIVLGNFTSQTIDKKIELYVKVYVNCPECGKPDTRLVKEKRYTFLICEACGARHSV